MQFLSLVNIVVNRLAAFYLNRVTSIGPYNQIYRNLVVCMCKNVFIPENENIQLESEF